MKTNVDKNLEDAKTQAWEGHDFIKSDYCLECNGDGRQVFNDEVIQCESCEELHKAEVRADRMHDEAKGG